MMSGLAQVVISASPICFLFVGHEHQKHVLVCGVYFSLRFLFQE